MSDQLADYSDLSGFSRAELRRRAVMFSAFAEQKSRDPKERNECERLARRYEEASRHAE